MGARVVADSRLLGPAVAGAVLSTIATVAQVAVVVAATSPITLMALGLPLIFAGFAAVAYGLIFGLRLTDVPPGAVVGANRRAPPGPKRQHEDKKRRKSSIRGFTWDSRWESEARNAAESTFSQAIDFAHLVSPAPGHQINPARSINYIA